MMKRLFKVYLKIWRESFRSIDNLESKFKQDANGLEKYNY